MGVSQMQGTPWHEETLHKAEGDVRRDKRNCKYYGYHHNWCSRRNRKCIGSSHCDDYRVVSGSGAKKKQNSVQEPGARVITDSRARRVRAPKGNSNEDAKKEYEYNGEIYHFSNGRWLDSSYCIVPDEIGRILAATFVKGKYFYKSTDLPRVNYPDKEEKTSTDSKTEKKKAYVKTPSFARGKVDIEELSKPEKITLAKYFGVRSTWYDKVDISELKLPIGIERRFKYYEHYTVGNLLRLTWETVLGIRNVGPKNKQIIEDAIRAFLENSQPQYKKKTVVEEPIVEENINMDSVFAEGSETDTDIEIFRAEDDSLFESKETSADGENEHATIINIALAAIITFAVLWFLWAIFKWVGLV